MKYAYFGKIQNFTAPFEYDDKNPDIVFSFGGDGTMLGAIHKYEKNLDRVKFIGINTGRLGFFNDYSLKELPTIFENLKKGNYNVDYYQLLEYTLENEEKRMSGYAVNEIAVSNPIHTQIIDIFINDKLFETFRGTGFLISPPTGSTAYNKSLGGSVIDPNIKAIQLTEIAPINNRVYKVLQSPLILSEKAKLKLSVKASDFNYIAVDGKYLEFKQLKNIYAKLSDKAVGFIMKKNTDFFDRVRRAFIE
ncbi:MAG TPA: NAD kinase [Bacilli bacterium]